MLNQLDNLTERVRGSNKLVDRWLHVRKHLLVAYYNLVGIKPGTMCIRDSLQEERLPKLWEWQNRPLIPKETV